MFGGIVRLGRGLGQSLLFGDAVFFADVVLLLPRAQLGGWLIAGKTDRQGDKGGDQHEQDQTLPPDIAATVFVAQFVEMGERFGSLGAFVVGIVNDQTATAEAIMAEDKSYTRHQELVPGNLPVPKQPGQGGKRIRAQAGAGKACPANGVSH